MKENTYFEPTQKSEAENKRLQAPTKAEIAEVKTIFADFGIKKSIPLFRTFAELDIFRRTEVNAVFA